MGTKRLADVVTEILDGVVSGEVINTRQAATDRYDDLDDDSKWMAGIEGMCHRINSKARSLTMTAAVRRSEAQAEFLFSLPAAVNLDMEGGLILPTRALTRAQFVRAIEIREEQIANDQKSLREWKRALKQADKFWASNPDWSFGECLNAIMNEVAA